MATFRSKTIHLEDLDKIIHYYRSLLNSLGLILIENLMQKLGYTSPVSHASTRAYLKVITGLSYRKYSNKHSPNSKQKHLISLYLFY
ncbi:hypothetical protein YC2023_024980 [Brassica napus]